MSLCVLHMYLRNPITLKLTEYKMNTIFLQICTLKKQSTKIKARYRVSKLGHISLSKTGLPQFSLVPCKYYYGDTMNCIGNLFSIT